jgi:hypothetical protein
MLKREGNKSVGNAQRRNKSKIINSKTESPNAEGTKKFRKGKKKSGNRDSTPSLDHSSLSPESRLA